MTRINKFIANCGVCSRRHAEELIVSGRVFVNGEVCRELSTQIGEGDRVFIDGAEIKPQAQKVFVLLNKPVGVVSTASDERGRKTVLDLIAGDARLSGLRLYPVGRLDADSDGLIILTNDGEFAKKISHPSSNTPKTYRAKVDDPINDGDIKILAGGVDILLSGGEIYKTKPCAARKIGKRELEITICEGKNRQIRKMLAKLGYHVESLTRIKEGDFELGDLKSGEYKIISRAEGNA
ncbi:MAG: rRNA pseudouridine synthase [Christensenellaceae bacterium]|jgi:pseudouridine synthase|nr:rRNA pseudouridine synthase [Christensenellaceae bacterium]